MLFLRLNLASKCLSRSFACTHLNNINHLCKKKVSRISFSISPKFNRFKKYFVALLYKIMLAVQRLQYKNGLNAALTHIHSALECMHYIWNKNTTCLKVKKTLMWNVYTCKNFYFYIKCLLYIRFMLLHFETRSIFVSHWCSPAINGL